MRGRGRATTELNASGLGLDPSGSGALGALPASRDPQRGNDDFGTLRCGFDHRLGNRADARTDFLHRTQDAQKIADVAGTAITRTSHQSFDRDAKGGPERMTAAASPNLRPERPTLGGNLLVNR